jgi:hypothetical protein
MPKMPSDADFSRLCATKNPPPPANVLKKGHFLAYAIY